ncbi:MAG: amidohydrolase family protein [Phyllobacterium sp.]
MFACTTLTDNASHITCLCHKPEFHAITRRINMDLSRRGFIAGAGTSVAALATLGLPARASAQAAAPSAPEVTVLTNFRLFDGTSSSLRDGLSLLIEGNQIKSVATGTPSAPDGARVIDCGGRTVMPGLIDAHWHAMFAALPVSTLLAGDVGYIHLAASAEAERTLMRGFTTIRDLGGPAFAFKQAIDEGLIAGPRIFPSGTMITASGGHGDLRPLSDLPRFKGGGLSVAEQIGGASIVDSPDEVRLRVREQLMQGASQIKIVGGGGVSSPRSPLDLLTLSEAELRAAVEVATDWNTFVTVHAYTPPTMQRAISAGARCIEHGHLMDDATAELMASKDIWLSLQPFLTDDDAVPLTGPSRVAQVQVFAGTDSAYKLAIKHGIKTAFGSDMLFSAALAARQGIMLTHLARWYSNADILKMATSTNAELLAMSGPRNPYPGTLGVVADGALADLLVVDGNPLENIDLLANTEKSLVLIMKDGKVYKDTIPA